jgi:hypothetical protein
MDHLARLLDAHARLISEDDLIPASGDVYYLLESELLTVELKH